MEEQAPAAVVGGSGVRAEQAVVGGGGVRVVARICCPCTTTAAGASSSFKVGVVRGAHPRSSDAARVSFTPSSSSSKGADGNTRKDDHRLDWCYLKEEPNQHVFLNEVSPLIQRLLQTTSSTNACVVACGAATAKDHLFTGSQDQPGVVTMAINQILEFTQQIGGSITVSAYQVLQDARIFDLLDPKDQEVHILEDADGRTHLKGLSKVDVKSVEEFTQLSCFDCSNQKKHPTNKSSSQLHTMGHQGLIIHISRMDQQDRQRVVAKMNFLNLAGYVDPKQKNNGEGAALQNSNKSIYALMNVVQALNSNQSFVPYRQSKVTRLLQDSLCKTSGAVLITCLDDICCQDTVSTLRLASRSSQAVNGQFRLSTSARSSSKTNASLSTNSKNSSIPFLASIHKPNSAVEEHHRPRFNKSACRTPASKKRSQPIIHSTKKSGSSLSASMKMKQNDAKPKMSARTLLCPSTSSSKEDALVVDPTAVKEAEEAQSSQGIEVHVPSRDEGFDKTGDSVDTISSEIQNAVSSNMQEAGYSLSHSHAASSYTDLDEIRSSNVPDTLVEKTPVNTNKVSPKLTERLREISNSLKLLSTRPLSVTAKKGMPINIDEAEHKTPVMRLKFEQAEDPKDTFQARSTGIKKSLVEECLTFLNSANKEQLKSLKGIGEKRANYIIELREESPDPFKEIDDLRDIIGMNQKEIKKMISGIIDS
ncbi:kinesin-like protein KIN-10B [Brachypodium distachyon]|uniref:Kinesin motor domain-containing protein n=1 Tax=Brachypodium distachyon TaxID=15368 RepID=A0A2K2DR26_BRADI|nr:kinesin-like protein KIN-10B [Brachypodium distachyon]PNT76733.1 hypothetical protein BRADI_1g52425v3 [Brachypodium distachyon]|eukprot:XP_010229992.1 kinesin-like protein KIN-10B [Brachypodium distachyon]